MATVIESEGELRTIYKPPSGGAIAKQLGALEKHCRHFISLSPFVCIGSSRAGGHADVSPRGGAPGFVHVLSDTLLAMPDRPGNNRLDTLSNLTVSPDVGLLFFVPGVEDMLRVNGTARISTDRELMERFVEQGKPPRSVLLIEVREAYLHCPKAMRRADLWNPERHVPRSALPTAGEIYRDHLKLDMPAAPIDQALNEDAKANLY